MKKIPQLRKEIDKIDKELRDLLRKRFSLTREIGLDKAKTKTEVFTKKREEEILSKCKTKSEKEIFKKIMDMSKKEQRQLA